MKLSTGLPEEKEDAREDWNENSDNDGLVRAIVASGFYPDIAMFKGRRNHFQLRKIRDVRIPVASCNYLPGAIGFVSPMAIIRRPSRSISQPQPIFYVYEDLLDVGMKLIMKITAVDPMAFIMLAHRLIAKPTEPNAIMIDDWLTVHPADNGSNDLELISQARAHLQTYLQWAVNQRILKGPITEEQAEAKSLFEQALLAFFSESNLFRPRLIAQPK